MKFVTKKQSKEFKNSETCIAVEYPLNDKDINIAVVKLKSDRYPSTGWAVNEKCKEISYITKGRVELVTESESVELQEGDVVLIDINEKYYWLGDCEMVMPCTPAWYPEQHKIVEVSL